MTRTELELRLLRLMDEGRADHVMAGRVARARRRVTKKRILRRLLASMPPHRVRRVPW